MSSKNGKNSSKGDLIVQRFGRYLLLDHLVNGGMAKICRARFLGEQVDKIVAIKMIQPQFSQDDNFKKMFMDEVKVSFGLIHPNIAQTYDYGMENDQLFTAMEYVDGKNLKQFLDRLREKKFVFPVEISVYIISQVCQGLHYAHTYTDKLTGKKTNIIHRDISPHNVMLSYDGAVKVIDFGIAKAETNTDNTKAGTIKGKLSYLAPEYLEGLNLDQRYDEFAVGITLWEMLCSRRLFKASNELAVLKEIQKCNVPAPSSINPNVPKELDQIVLKALQKDRNLRYENLDQMNRALVRFLYTNYPDFNSTDIAYFSRELFADDIKNDRNKFKEFGQIDITPFLKDLNKNTSLPRMELESVPSEKISKKQTVLDFGFKGSGYRVLKSVGKHSVPKDGYVDLNDTHQVDEIKNRAVNDHSKSDNNQNSDKTLVQTKKRIDNFDKRAEQKKVKTGTNKKLYTKYSGKNNIFRYAIGVAAVVAIVYLGGGDSFDINILVHEIKKVSRGLASPVNPPAPPIKTPRPQVVEKTGRLIIENYDKYKHNVFLNNEKISLGLFDSYDIVVGKEYILRVQVEDREHWVQDFKIITEGEELKLKIPETPSMQYGYLFNTDKSCAKGTIEFELFGEKRIEKLPIIDRRGIPFPMGETEIIVRFAEDNLPRKKIIKVVTPNSLIDFCELSFW